MKFNLKGRGSNHAVQEGHLASILQSVSQPQAKGSDTIIIGADVAHPTGSARPGCPSIAAVVGSTDDHYLHYPGSMRLQISRQEFITELGDMVKERLIDWAEKHNQTLPANMLFYRDGVSESQYKCVRESEIPQLKTAYQIAYEYFGGSGPAPPFKLTFIVVGKRHNTRFFTDETCQENSFRSDLMNKELRNKVALAEEEGQEFIDRGGKTSRMNHNLLPGMVVDRVIVHPYSNDFFLQSHKPLQGTGRSAHYFVLTNQMALSSDDLQRVTHALSYIYARATKGVSYCSPAYYADRLCDRGRAWLREFLIGSRGITRLEKEKDDVFKTRARREIDDGNYWRPQRFTDTKYGQPRKNPWHPNLDDVMFYL
jgi:eukaryotic translation initiation factor 2C